MLAAKGALSQAGNSASRRSSGEASKTRPAVARNESWKPRSKSAVGLCSVISAATSVKPAAISLGRPIAAPTAKRLLMSEARTTEGEVPTSRA
jgi:hypothetical protein